MRLRSCGGSVIATTLPADKMSDDERVYAGALNRDAIAALINGAVSIPLVSEYIDLNSQLQPNGFDLTVRDVAGIRAESGAAALGVADADRRLPEPTATGFHHGDWWRLTPGGYRITFNEVVSLPRWLMALGRPRSSLLRMGVALHTSVWDAGYSGRSQALLLVHQPGGLHLQRNTRVAQLVFLPLHDADATGYDGRYQRENR